MIFYAFKPMKRQFTATVYIVEDERVLLIKHRKLRKWLPPGGHLDPNETPPEAAKREAFEETGMKVELVPQENIWIDHWNAKSLERPFLCLLEEIPAYGDEPAHQHMDLCYLGRPIGGKLKENPKETDGIRWFTLDEINKLEPDVDIFAETQKVLLTILTKHSLELDPHQKDALLV